MAVVVAAGGSSSCPSLAEFLVGPSLASAPALRSQLLQLCLQTGSLLASIWVEVLSAIRADPSCLDIVGKIVKAHLSDAAVRSWALATRDDSKAGVALRVLLHLLCSGDSPAPEKLCQDAADALLAGTPLPPEVVQILDATTLWNKALEKSSHMAAVALVKHVPQASRLCAALEPFLKRGLLHAKRTNRRACVDVLEATHGAASVALLSLLSEQQPLHLLQGVEAPPVAFADAAAELALRYSDSRVHAFALEVLPLSEVCLLETFGMAAVRHAGAERAPEWTRTWQRKAAHVLSSRTDFDGMAILLAKQFPPGSLSILLATWAEGPCMLDPNADPKSMRALRRHDPAIAAIVAQRFLAAAGPASAAATPPTLLLELGLCQPAGGLSPDLSAKALSVCGRPDLPDAADIMPAAVATHLASADAATALWALGALPGARAVSCASLGGGSFAVQLSEGQHFAPTSWVSARAACALDPVLAAWYPKNDPDYASVRATLLGLGPAAAAHAEASDVEVLKSWIASDSLSREQRLQWLAAATRLIEAGVVALKGVVESSAIAWASTASKDAPLVSTALSALAAAGAGPSALEALWTAVRSGDVARQAVQLVGVGEVPPALLERLLASSSLSSALAALHLAASHGPHVPTLAALAVRAVAATGSQANAPHPSVQLCRALTALSRGTRELLLRRLLHHEQPSLPAEGSPKGEAHHRHVRLWLCVGSILEVEPGFAEEVVAIVEPALRTAMQLPTRVLLQNVWARAAWVNSKVLAHLADVVSDLSLPEAFAPRCVSVAAQLVLHPSHGGLAKEGAEDISSSPGLKRLLEALVAWSATYVQTPRLLASLALYHALDKGLLKAPGWYLESLQQAVSEGAAFKKLRETVDMDRWVSGAWATVQPVRARPLDVAASLAQKHVSDNFWSASSPEPSDGQAGAEGDPSEAAACYQRRPESLKSSWFSSLAETPAAATADVVVVGSLLDNLPNMAGLVRTAEALLGTRGEVALHSQVVLSDPAFLKMSVASERAGHVIIVPRGPRLVEFLREKRCEGFVVAALEQTSTSVLLCSETKLPQRMVLLVGSEQHGLPVWLVQSGLIDLFLELPLLGRTGSLNAHVAASMALWHYRLQH